MDAFTRQTTTSSVKLANASRSNRTPPRSYSTRATASSSESERLYPFVAPSPPKSISSFPKYSYAAAPR